MKDSLRLVIVTNNDVQVLQEFTAPDPEPETNEPVEWTSLMKQAVEAAEEFFKKPEAPTIAAILIQIRPYGKEFYCPFASMRVGDKAEDETLYELILVDNIRQQSAGLLRWPDLVEMRVMAQNMIEFMIAEVGSEPRQQFQIDKLESEDDRTPLMRRFVNDVDGIHWRELFQNDDGWQVGLKIYD
jgi:hypothetical protein